MRIDVGIKTEEPNNGTLARAKAAAEMLQSHIDSVAGRPFWGLTGLDIVWEGGQITAVHPTVTRKIRQLGPE